MAVRWWVFANALLIVVGLLAIVFGEFDDSPGMQGLGLLLIVLVTVRAYRRRG
jgi:hypothetical protein